MSREGDADKEKTARLTLAFVASIRHQVVDLTFELRRKFENAECDYSFVVFGGTCSWLSANIWVKRGDRLIDMLVEITANETEWLLEANNKSWDGIVDREFSPVLVKTFDEVRTQTPALIDETYKAFVLACVQTGF